MDKQYADSIIVEYLPKIYGFAMKKTFSYDEAEDLGGDIIQEVYLSLLREEEIINLEGYIWRISTHTYAKYVSRKKKQQGVSIDGMEIPFYEAYDSLLESTGADTARLRREIAFLSRSRREIIYLFYYENRSISYIASRLNLPEGTVKWHLNRARNELKEGFTLERKIGTLGISPIAAKSLWHIGIPDPDGFATEKYLEDRLSLNIVYSVYQKPGTLKEISEELGVTPVFLEDKVEFLEANGFLVRTTGGRFTTYVDFLPRTYCLEQEDAKLKSQWETARILAAEYVPLVRQALASVKDVSIPGGNRELLDAAAIFYGIENKSQLAPIQCGIMTTAPGEYRDLSKYYARTLAGGCFIPRIELYSVPSDPNYRPQFQGKNYCSCGDMYRLSSRYPLSAWSVDTRFCSRTGGWKNNLLSDYEALYEFMSGTLAGCCEYTEKRNRLMDKGYLSEDGTVNILVVKDSCENFFGRIPPLGRELKERFVRSALEYAVMEAKNYPPQMQDLIINTSMSHYMGDTTAIMVLDLLYESGTFRPLTEQEKITSQLILFSDLLP